MARTSQTLPQGNDATNHLSVGILALIFPASKVQAIVNQCEKGSKRIRDLPAVVVVFYTIAMSLFSSAGYESVLRWLLAGLQWLGNSKLRISGKGALSAARQRLGETPLKRIFETLALPLADPESVGSFWKGLHVVAWDGSTLALQDTPDNSKSFERSSNQHGPGAWPQARFVALVEVGTHLIFAAQLGGYRTSEISLAKELVGKLGSGMVCLADRLFPGFELWNQASANGACLVWRAKLGLKLKQTKRLSDGSYLAEWPDDNQRKRAKALVVRVVEYQLKRNHKEGAHGPPETYRIITNILDEKFATAVELAQLYPERWEIELCIRETKSGMRKGQVTLRSKTAELVRQEFWGMLLAHYAVRKMMAHAALETKKDPDGLSFQKCIEIIKSTQAGSPLSFPPSD